jgi:hypothetical protein
MAYYNFCKVNGTRSCVEKNVATVANWSNAATSKEYIERLQRVIQTLHKCRATHKTSVYVKEEFPGQPAWEGDVEDFSLFGHPKAKFCYAWGHGEPEQFATILSLRPFFAHVFRTFLRFGANLGPRTHVPRRNIGAFLGRQDLGDNVPYNYDQ